MPIKSQKKSIIEEKLNTSIPDLCKKYKSLHLIPFAKEIFNIGFKEKPNYKKLRFLLEKNLLDQNMVPNKQYDWNKDLNEDIFQQVS